jgi:transposase
LFEMSGHRFLLGIFHPTNFMSGGYICNMYFSGCLLINRRKNQIKMLCWEGDGFMMFYKRLEKGTFEIPKGDEIKLDVETLSCLLHGIKLSSIHKRKRYIHAA